MKFKKREEEKRKKKKERRENLHLPYSSRNNLSTPTHYTEQHIQKNLLPSNKKINNLFALKWCFFCGCLRVNGIQFKILQQSYNCRQTVLRFLRK